MEENHLFKTYSMHEMLDELDLIERYQQPGHQHYLSEMTSKQKRLYQHMNIEPPS